MNEANHLLIKAPSIEQVRSYRFAPSRGAQSISAPVYQRVETAFSIGTAEDDINLDIAPTPSM